MPQIEAFRGIRYAQAQIGSLSQVICPPYDVIDPALHEQLYKLHPANAVRLELNRPEPGDREGVDVYARAARFLRDWQTEGVLATDPEPAIYVYHQQFEHAGRPLVRRGFMARVRLERFGEGQVFPHEETMSGPKADRLLLTRACRANLSQVFGLYPDAEAAAQENLEAAIAGRPPLEAIDHLGVVHRLWPVTDVAVVARLAAAMTDKPIFIADGHHRYETACNYRDELAAAGQLDPRHPANFVLMMCVGMSDPGMIVLPTHRLFRGLPALDSTELIAKLGGAFATRIAGEGSDLADAVWREIESRADQGTMGFFTTRDQRWVVAALTDEGRRQMADAAAEHSRAWQGLGVSLLHRLVMGRLLAPGLELPKPEYVHLTAEVVAGLDSDQFELAALVMPATLEHIRTISQQQERMPAKSTYFYPKLTSGLVINPLE